MPFIFVPLLSAAIALTVKLALSALTFSLVLATLDLISMYVVGGFAMLIYRPLDMFMMNTPAYIANKWYCYAHYSPTLIGMGKQFLYCEGTAWARFLAGWAIALTACVAVCYLVYRVSLALYYLVARLGLAFANGASGARYVHRFQANTLSLLPAWRAIPVTLAATVTNALHGEGAAQAVFARAQDRRRNEMAVPISCVVEGVELELEELVSFGKDKEDLKKEFICHVCAYVEKNFVNTPDFSLEKNNHAQVCVATFGDKMPKRNGGHIATLLRGVFRRAAIAAKQE